jgi:hypothetical protein
MEIPEINYNLKHTACSEHFYAREEMQKLIKENAEMRKFIFDEAGYYWIGKPDSNVKINNKSLIKKLSQTQLCMNALTHCIAEYLSHLKRNAMPYMEAIYRKNDEEIKKHNDHFLNNHVKSLMLFQKYVQEIINDTNMDAEEFENKLSEGKYNESSSGGDMKSMEKELHDLCQGINIVHTNKYDIKFEKVV